MTFQADRIMGMFPAVQFVYYGTVSHERCLLYHSMFFKCCQNPVDCGYSIIAAFVISLNTIVNLYGAEGLGRFLQHLIHAFSLFGPFQSLGIRNIIVFTFMFFHRYLSFYIAISRAQCFPPRNTSCSSLDGRRPIKIGSASYACKQSKSQLSILALLVPTTSLSQFLSKHQSHIKFPRFSDFPFYPDSHGTTPAVLLPRLPAIRTSWLQG